MLNRMILSDEELATLKPEGLRDYFAPCLAALEFPDGPPAYEVPPPVPKGHKVYFIRGAGGAIKIGFTQQKMNERLKCIQNGSPVKLEVIATVSATRDLERVLHKQFAAHRLHGEWFSPHPDILAENDRLASSEGE